MIKKFLSKNIKNMPYLAEGVRRLKALTHAGASGRREYAPDDDVMIICDTGAKSVTVMDLPVSHYFGYNVAVAMRCWCRGIVLTETTGGTAALSIVDLSESRTRRYSITVNGVEVLGGTGTTVLVGDAATGVTTYTNWPSGGVIVNGLWNGGLLNGVVTTVSGIVVSSTAVQTAWPDYTALKAQADAAAHQRSAAFLTDGTELASALTNGVNTDPVAAYNVLYTTLWSGAAYASLFNWTYKTGGGIDVFSRAANLNFTVPDDVCYQKNPVPTYPGVTVSRGSYPATTAGDAAYYAALGSMAGVVQNWEAEWAAAQATALTREQARRKNCSDGQYAYLRHGFLSPEFETFVKQQHPGSTLVRRSIPMVSITVSQTAPVIVLNPSYVTNTTGLYRTTTTTKRVSFKYSTTNADGTTKDNTIDISGTSVVEDYFTRDDGNTLTSPWTRITYTNLPVVQDSTGSSNVSLQQKDLIIGEESSTAIFLLKNGTTVGNVARVATSQYGTPIRSFVRSYSADFPDTSEALVYTHPQFLYDYIKASKPVEINPKIPTDLASTNWLSSKLAHGELITVIPLSFVTTKNEDRGMYPYSLIDEVPAQIKLSGYAKFKFDYFKASFTFVSWTEFTADGKITHDGTASYDKETNPTSVTINTVTHVLQPRFIPYDAQWTTLNCVCIASISPWSDTKKARKTQNTHTAATTPIDPTTGKAITLTAEEALYKAIRQIIV